MANVTTELKVVVRSVGKGEIDKLSDALVKLGKKAVEPVNNDLKKSVQDLKRLSSQSTQTKNNVKGFSAAFKELANNLEFGSKEFKEATAEAKKLDAQLQKMEGRKPATGGRLRSAAQTAGAVAAAGVFGGPEGALGAGIGAIFGGPLGAAAGGAIGAQVGQLRQAAGATAEYAANIEKLRIALKGVTTSQEEYSQGLEFIQQTTKDFAIPQEVVTRQFTKLQASVQGAGGNLEDTKTAFNGIIAAVRATGGSLSDVDAALTATAQVFSKGKVSAEELRQQIGERLPGAFTLFAESMGKTPQELDKALENGQVSLQDFQKFAKAIFDRYGENAKVIADSPEAAGDRLKVSLERLSESIGILLKPIGSAFQNTFTGIVDFINIAIKRLTVFLEMGEEGTRNKVQRLSADINRLLRLQESRRPLQAEGLIKQVDIEQTERDLARKIAELQAAQAELRKITGFGAQIIQQPEAGTGLSDIILGSDAGGQQAADKMRRASQELLDLAVARNQAFTEGNAIRVAELDFQIKIQKLAEQFNAGEIDFNTAKIKSLDAHNKLIDTGLKLRDKEKKALADLSKGQKNVTKELTETEKLYKAIGQTLQQSIVSALEGIIYQTESLRESLSNVLKQVANLFLQFGMKAAFSATGLSDFFGLNQNVTQNAYGNAYGKNGIVPFARGGVVDKPTVFPFANGIGVMGEAGAEAIMPLRRGRDGRLGVQASGGVGDIVVNVDASGSSVQGDGQQGKALGQAIGAAVQAELIKQKRPGGLLS